MRLAHLVLAVALVACVLAASREPATRVCVVVLLTGMGEVVFGLAGVMALFQTIGALGEARSPGSHLEALAATAVVLTVATAFMSAWLFVGAWIVTAVV